MINAALSFTESPCFHSFLRGSGYIARYETLVIEISKLFETANPCLNQSMSIKAGFYGIYATLSFFFESRQGQGSGQVMKG
jgi:hypothetical protein